ncbi:MAG TPA: anti-sigma factor [Actinomycetota bacterium]|nr:anti-sigma factor [Actinomycetota bacterium]
MKRNHEEMQELLAAYALGAVPEDEINEVRAHILSCEECMREADEFAEASASLAVAVGSERLPAGFADRVLELVQTDASAATTEPRRRRRWLPAYALAASMAVVVVLGFQVFETQREIDRQREVLSALLHQTGVEMRGTSGAVARVVPSGSGSLFAAAGLQEAPQGHTYQLWLIKEGAAPVSAGTFDVSDGLAVIETQRSIAGFDGAAVTIEQAGGSAQPTTDPILQG